MRAKIDATNLSLHDLKDQPPSKYVLLVADVLGGQRGIGVDACQPLDSGVVRFYRHIFQHGASRGELTQEVLVATIPTHLNWTMVERPLFEVVSYREVAAKSAQDEKDMEALAEEFFPEEHAKARAAIEGMTTGMGEVAIKADRAEAFGNYL